MGWCYTSRKCKLTRVARPYKLLGGEAHEADDTCPKGDLNIPTMSFFDGGIGKSPLLNVAAYFSLRLMSP